MGPALPVFRPKTSKRLHFCTWKDICSKILVIIHYLKKESPVFVYNWVQNKCLLFNIFLLIFHCLTYSAMGRLNNGKNWVGKGGKFLLVENTRQHELNHGHRRHYKRSSQSKKGGNYLFSRGGVKVGEFFDPKRYLVVTEKEKEENIWKQDLQQILSHR